MSKRRAAILSVVLEGRTQAETARHHGVSESTVSRWVARYRAEGDAAFEARSRRLAERGLVDANPKKRPKSSYVRFATDLPNECRQSDFCLWRLSDGSTVEVITWLDDCSRYALSVTAHRRITGPIAAAPTPPSAWSHP